MPTNDLPSLAGHENAMTVGAAIQLAWDNHHDLPPIDLTEEEMRYLGSAAIVAVENLGGKP